MTPGRQRRSARSITLSCVISSFICIASWIRKRTRLSHSRKLQTPDAVQEKQTPAAKTGEKDSRVRALCAQYGLTRRTTYSWRLRDVEGCAQSERNGRLSRSAQPDDRGDVARAIPAASAYQAKERSRSKHGCAACRWRDHRPRASTFRYGAYPGGGRRRLQKGSRRRGGA